MKFPIVTMKMSNDIPSKVMRVPPKNSFFQAKKIHNKKTNHGSAFGLFSKIPINPSLSKSAPDTKANRNTNAPNIEPKIRASNLEI